MFLTVRFHDIRHAVVLAIVHFLNLIDHDLFRMHMLGMFQKILFICGEVDPFQVFCYVGR